MQQGSLFDDGPREIKPVDPHLRPQDKVRLTGKIGAVLDCLRRGPVTNYQLAAVGGLRAMARVHDLRKHGFKIDCEPQQGGVWLVTLKEEPDGFQ